MTTNDPLARFWDRIAKRYASTPVPDQAVYERKLAQTAALLKPTDQVLEIGCGTGTTAINLAPHVAHITATDISTNMLDIARHKAAGINNVTFKLANAEQLPETDQPMDVVLAHSILHLVRQPDQVLHHLAAVLKPGGYLVSTTACIQDFMAWFKYLVPIGSRLGLLPQVQVFSKEDLLNWHAAAGFSVTEQWQPGPKNGVFIIAKLNA